MINFKETKGYTYGIVDSEVWSVNTVIGYLVSVGDNIKILVRADDVISGESDSHN